MSLLNKLGKFWKGLNLSAAVKPGNLILVRHGETDFNHNKMFTGWIDADLSTTGVREVEHAARLLLERGYSVDSIYTSRLKRAIKSTWIILQELHQVYRPVHKSWRLNERMYGALEGTSKIQAVMELGEEEVQKFRRGLVGRPPEMLPNHPYWHKSQRKYEDLDPNDIPTSESLLDTMKRTIPLLESHILPDIRMGKTVMIVAHANSLRGIVKHLENLSPEEIAQVGIPNGIPLIYKFDVNLKPIKQNSAVPPLSGEFLEKRGALRVALDREAELAKSVGIDPRLFSPQNKAFDPRVSSLTRLNFDRSLYSEAMQLHFPSESESPLTKQDKDQEIKSGSDAATYLTDEELRIQHENLPPSPRIVIIRHGKTEYNKLGIFTGWDDAPLAEEGKEEAQKAGRSLKLHGIEFDVVYTSWLSRAIETALLVLDQLDSLWLPINKSWRLNERMYGALTKLSKKMIAETYGQDKFRKWRRGYDVRPPPVSSFSQNYPGNDDRYLKYVRDIEVSVFESVIRSLSHGKLEIHRKFPKTESLKDCMSRTIPYFTNIIVPQSIALDKNVLIASSENAIRGLLMHLCEIPIHRIHEVEIPTGLPLIFDVKRKCIRVLESPIEEDNSNLFLKYNFGSSPELLFRPCNLKDGEVLKYNYPGPNGQTFSFPSDPYIRLPPATTNNRNGGKNASDSNSRENNFSSDKRPDPLTTK